MNRIFPAVMEAAAASVFLIPIFIYLHRKRFHRKCASLAAFVFAFYLCAVYAMAGLPNVLYLRFHPNFNFVPFRYLFTDVTSVLNVVLFVPLGCMLPLLRKKFRFFPRTLLFGFCVSAFLEICQIFTYRATDVNDLMTNTLGTALGYLLGIVLLKVFPKLSVMQTCEQIRTIFTAVLFVMFFLQPFLSVFLWKLI